MPTDYVQAANWWTKLQEPADPRFEAAREIPLMGRQQEGAIRMEYPYIRRVCATLRAFLLLDEAGQRIVIAATSEGIWWRGEPMWQFPRVIAEVERQREIGPEAYRKEAIERMRKMKVGGKLPYDKRRRDG